MTDFEFAFIHGSSSTGRFQGSMDAESSRRMLRSKKKRSNGTRKIGGTSGETNRNDRG